MKKRISSRVICLAIALVMLTGALTVSAINGSPYENLKNALFDMLFFENFTMESEFSVRVDGQLHERGWGRDYFSETASLYIGINEIFWRYNSDEQKRLSYHSRNLNISTVSEHDGWYLVSRSFWIEPQSMGYALFGVDSRNSNMVRLVELLLDLAVGDLRHNMSMTSQEDGTRRISGAVNSNQMPEVVRLLLNMLIENTFDDGRYRPNRQREDFENVLQIPVESASVNYLRGEADVDADGNLIYLSVLMAVTIENIFGEIYELEYDINLRFSNIGTTVPKSPFADAIELFTKILDTPELSSLSWQPTLYFRIDETGHVDISSITHNHPQSPFSIWPVLDDVLYLLGLR